MKKQTASQASKKSTRLTSLAIFALGIAANASGANGGTANVSMAAAGGIDFDEFEVPGFHIIKPENCTRDYHPSEINAKDFMHMMAPGPMALQQISSNGPNTTSSTGPVERPETHDPNRIYSSWVPTGADLHLPHPKCQIENLEKAFLGHKLNDQADQLRAFMKSCENDLTRFAPDDARALLGTLTTTYRLCEHPKIRRVEIATARGNVLRGTLALHDTTTRRPLVIFQGGAFSNPGDPSQRQTLMHLFEEGPFNVLELASITGTDYVADNKHISIGGVDEGALLYQIAKQIHLGPLGAITSSIHISAVSLGGNSALYSALYAMHNLDLPGEPVISSISAFSPVVNLQAALKSLFSDSIRGKAAGYFFYAQILNLLKHTPELKDLFPNITKESKPDEYFRVIRDGAVKYYSQYQGPWLPNPFDEVRIKNADDLWRANDYLAAVRERKQITIPTFVFSATTDWLVEPETNAVALAERTRSAPIKNLETVLVSHGNHGGFPNVFGWRFHSRMYQAYIASHSPELQNARHEESAPVQLTKLGESFHGRGGQEHVSQEFIVKKGEAKVLVRFNIFDPHEFRGECLGRNAITAPLQCMRAYNAELVLPREAILAATGSDQMPATEAEAEGLTRWLNVNAELVDADGHKLQGTNNIPHALHWTSYQVDQR